MREESKQFLFNLLGTASPSGFEEEAGRVWRAEAETFADEVTVDSSGNSYARLKGNGPRVMIEGHIDEIGVMISHIDDDGFLWFKPIGGWDDQVLVGQRIRIAGKHGPVVGVIGKKPIHFMDGEERNKVSKIKSLWIDIGAKSAEEALQRVSLGDAGVIEQPILEMGDDLISCRGLDNRVGAFVALEALRMLADGERPAADVWAVAPVQEEIGLYGARTSAFGLEPDLAIAIDLTLATDHPDSSIRDWGLVKMGGGPAFARGASIHPQMFRMLVEAADAEGITYSVETAPSSSGTDADAISRVRAGIPTGLVSVPGRYVHSPSETISLTDTWNSSRVIAALVRRLDPDLDFRRV